MQPRILVVDDDVDICKLIQEVLLSADMEAHGMTDSAKAAERLKREKFDAVFLDIRMPPPDGIQLTELIRGSGLNQNTPIVVITGDEDHNLMARAFKAGATFYLHKPIDRPKLLRLLRTVRPPIQDEKRRFRRIKTTCKVSLKLGQEQLHGNTLDLSLNGMSIQAERSLPVGSLVEVSLELLRAKPPMRGTAHVVRLLGKDCMGLRLERLAATESEKLQEFLLPLISAMDE